MKNNIRIIEVFAPLTKDMFVELDEIFQQIGKELAKNVYQQKMMYGLHSTTAYFELEQRCFKAFLKVKVLPDFEITDQDITEVTNVQMLQGIEAEKTKSDTTTYWTQFDA